MLKVTVSFCLSIFQRKAPFKCANLYVPMFQMFGEGLPGVLRHDFCPVRLKLLISVAHIVSMMSNLGSGTASGSEMENGLLEYFAQCSNDGTLMGANGSLVSRGALQNCLYLIVFHLPHNEVPQM